MTNRCTKCGVLLSRTYHDNLCLSCREEQNAIDEEARLAAWARGGV
jgi:hypothetical protein